MRIAFIIIFTWNILVTFHLLQVSSTVGKMMRINKEVISVLTTLAEAMKLLTERSKFTGVMI